MLKIILFLGSLLLYLVMWRILMHFNNIGFISNKLFRWLDMAIFALMVFPFAYITSWFFAICLVSFGSIVVYYQHFLAEKIKERNKFEEKGENK